MAPMGDGLAIRARLSMLRNVMLRNARTWIALAVIAGGITAAVMLPKEKTPSGAPERQGSDDLVRRDFDFEEAIAQAHDSEPAAAAPPVFQDLAQRPMGSASADDDPYAAKEPIQHKIIDGDTLRSLAKRYLGEESRYLEIFEANREQLSSPEVLPIGAELLIPLTPPPMPTAAAPRVEAAPVSLGQGNRRVPIA
ncbi:LysM domain-containing protein [Durusdinium trenchii]|uniref:LysM domain-containing protein n=1 Tax=Durusdinium trenchii TaxID=1381693 RepID=A0ABP0RLY4_9DINO